MAKTVPAGQTSVNVSASRLGKGVNVVTVSGADGKESCKVKPLKMLLLLPKIMVSERQKPLSKRLLLLSVSSVNTQKNVV